jgi:hypothetical protein
MLKVLLIRVTHPQQRTIYSARALLMALGRPEYQLAAKGKK